MLRINSRQLMFINKNAIPWIIWSIAGLYYFYEIILRVLPGTMTSELMHVFRINGTQLGVFTACYYWSYTFMQIPAGLIVDRYSLRKTLFLACLLCVAGFGTVHATRHLFVAEIGRFVVGLGSAFAYVSALKAASVWLSKRHFGLASCILDSLGMVGAVFAEIVVVKVNVSSGYSTTIHFLLIAGVCIALLILMMMRDAPSWTTRNVRAIKINRLDRADIFRKLIVIARNPQIWLIGIVGCLFYLPSSVIGDVWGIPYLRGVYHITKQEASYLMATFFVGWTLIGPFLGALSDRLQKRRMPLIITILIDAILLSIVIFTPLVTSVVIPLWLLYVIFFSIGVATGTHPLVFALAKENYHNQIAGTVIAFTNTLIMLGGVLFQPLVGVLLDLNHGTLFRSGAMHYSSLDYGLALSIVPLLLFVSVVLMHFVKETA